MALKKMDCYFADPPGTSVGGVQIENAKLSRSGAELFGVNLGQVHCKEISSFDTPRS